MTKQKTGRELAAIAKQMLKQKPIIKKVDNSVENFNRIFDKYENKFDGKTMYNLHNFLWQIIINEKWNDAAITCFYAVFGDDGYEIGICERNRAGYNRMRVPFKTKNHDEAVNIAVELSKDVYGHTTDEVNEIVSSTMRTSRKQKV